MVWAMMGMMGMPMIGAMIGMMGMAMVGAMIGMMGMPMAGAKHPENTWSLNHEYHFRMLRPTHPTRKIG